MDESTGLVMFDVWLGNGETCRNMIPYKVIRRWSVGRAIIPAFHDRPLELIHEAAFFGRPAVGLVLILGIIEQGLSAYLYSLLLLGYIFAMPVSSFFAVRAEKLPIKLMIWSMAPDWIIAGHSIVVMGFDPFLMTVFLCSVFANAVSVNGLKVILYSILGCGFAAFITICSLQEIPSPPSSQGIHSWPATIFCLGYVSIVGFQSFRMRAKLSQRRKEIESLNTQIKEQVLVRYLPPDLINDIFDGKISMDTKPHSQQITVLFSDLAGFTKMSEQHGAEVVSEFLNDYLTIMNETIFANKGTIDKFIGDAIMVIFGAPVSMSEEDQAKNAARCAIAMQRGMVLVNEKWKAKGIDEVSMRIGIHQGMAVVGNFGSKQRVDYTAIGPSVNLAARIETACTPGEIYVSQEVRELLHDEPPTDLAGEFELKGIEGKTSLYKLVDWAN